jgi:hypothetical protein
MEPKKKNYIWRVIPATSFLCACKRFIPKGAPAWLVMHALADKKGDVLLCKRRGLPSRVDLVATVILRETGKKKKKKEKRTPRSIVHTVPSAHTAHRTFAIILPNGSSFSDYIHVINYFVP